MPRFVIEACTRFVVDGADTPVRALDWFEDLDDIDVDVSPISYGHLQVVGELGDDVALVQLEPGTYAAWKQLHVKPIAGRWAPEAWPSRACPGSSGGSRMSPPETPAPTPIRPLATNARDQSPAPYVPEAGRGGFHPIQRLLGLLVDVRCEAHAAKQVSSKRDRDASFDEIAALADQAMQLVERYAKPAPTAQLREVTARAR